jgi:hypothetical protein
MFDYRSLLFYYSKGNTIAQVATLCQCSRTTVYKAVKRAKEINLELPVPYHITDKMLLAMLYPKRGHNQEYDFPDFEAIRRDKVKRKLTLDVAWRRYYKRTVAAGKKAYKKTQFFKMFKEFFHRTRAKIKNDVIAVFVGYEMAIGRAHYSQSLQAAIMEERDKWLKKMKLDGSKLQNCGLRT